MAMSGYPIIQRIIEVGYRNPTEIYEVYQDSLGLALRKTHTIKECTVDMLASILKDQVAPHRPVFVSDEHMSFKMSLKHRGIRVI
jgi:hypothetical protein